MMMPGGVKRALASLVLWCFAGAAAALEITSYGQNRSPRSDAYETSGWPFEPLLPPGDVALIDDWWHNTEMYYRDARTGDSLGVRATSPSGTVSENIVTRGSTCWLAGLTQFCPADSSGAWYLGTRIRLQALGTWRVDVLANNVVVGTLQFQLKPYNLLQDSGAAQTLPVKTTTPQPLTVRVTRPDGTPAPGKGVRFSLTSSPRSAVPAGGLTESSTYTGSASQTLGAVTGADGVARIYFETGGKAGTYVVTATSELAPGISRVFTVTATATPDPTDAAIVEKNLGLDPAGNSGCASATDPFTPNPIHLGTGNKVALETDYVGVGPFPLAMSRAYNSVAPRAGRFGPHWRGFYDRAIVVSTTTIKTKTTTVAEAVRHDGRVLRFTLNNGAWVAEPDVVDRLASLPGGGFRLVCGNDQAETYTASGLLSSVASREGFPQQLFYDGAGRLSTVWDDFGRSLSFSYDASNRVTGMTDPAGRTTLYTYTTAGNLGSVQYPDLTTRLYHYENPSFPRALTGITDERGVRLTTYSYNSSGDAVQTVRAGGAQPLGVLYYADGSRLMLDGNGNYRRFGFALIQGVARRTSLDNAACASCGNAVQRTGYSASGYVSSVTDYRGTQTTFVRDARGLETSRTEAAGTSEARTITTTWHANFRLPLTITRTGQRTSFTYDAAGRLLTRTITDTATNATRTWSHTYDARGLLATVDGPRTDVADITRFGYDAQGNLTSVTNALGHVTAFTSHDAHGRPLAMTDPNGLVVDFAYDLRGRLVSRDAGGEVTRFSYTPAGQPLRTTAPDGSWVERVYDAAQQEVGLLDSAGQRVAYTLDRAGRRIREEHFDSVGTSVYLRGWSLDPLGRVLAELDAQGAVQWRHAYDANGNRIASSDAYGASTVRGFDALDRLRSITDPLNAVTSLQHDARDNLVRVTDPLGVVTQYAYDGLDNLTQENSADAGNSTYSYDAAGNLRGRSWANGRAVAFTLDALDRVTLEDYGAGVRVTHAWDGPDARGRRSAATDPDGGNVWSHDRWGRVTQASRTTAGRTLTTGYVYDASGRLAAMVYPSGRRIGYGYDAVGRVQAISVDGQVLLQAIAWQPFGGARGWMQGNGRPVGRSYDRDGRLQAQSFDIGSRTYGYDLKGRLTAIAEPWGMRNYGYDSADRLTGESGWAGSYGYVWDGNGNRRSQTGPLGATTYAYAAGTNRLQAASGVDARAITHDTAGNMTAEGGYGFGYDARNRLALATSTTSTRYGHDALGRRIFKSGVATRHYVHDEQRRVIGEYDATAALSETVWLGSMPVAVLRGGKTFWIDADHLDTPRVVSDAGGQIVWRWRSEAFGNTQTEDDPSGLGAFEFNHRFPGQLYDAETALHHNDHRDYRAHTGRYVQADPIGLAGEINTYAYALGNPLSFFDSHGLDATVCLYPGAGTAGHVGIGVNSASTVGLYPRSESPGLAAITGTPGVVKADTKSAEQCKTVSTTAEQDKKMADFIARMTANPGTYRLGGNNCTNFVRSVLQQAGVSTPFSPGPRPYFEALPGSP